MRKTLIIGLIVLQSSFVFGFDTGWQQRGKFTSIEVGGGYGNDGTTLDKDGNIQFDGDITSDGTASASTVLIDSDNGEALLIRRDGDAGDCLYVDTRDKSSFAGSYYGLYVEPTGGQHTGNANGVVGVYALNRVNTGTQTVFLRGFQSQVATKGDSVLSGAGGQGASGAWNAAIHDSTGAATELRGTHSVATILPGGSTTTAGLLDVAVGLNAGYGFGSSSGTGTATTGAGIRIESPTTTAAGSRVITTGHGLLIEDQEASGITTAYAIKTGTGLVLFGGRVMESKGADINSGSQITLGTDGTYFDVVGTTAVDHITTTNWNTGSVITLQFDASVTVNHNSGSVPATGAAVLLSGAGNFAASADDTLTLRYDGVTFREQSRTVI